MGFIRTGTAGFRLAGTNTQETGPVAGRTRRPPTERMNMIRLGIVGFGLRSNGNRTRLQDLDPEVQVVGVVDPDEAGVREHRLRPEEQDQVVFYPDLTEMINKASLDGLMIGSLDYQHAGQAIEAAKYDIPLFLEKPVAVSMEQNIAVEEAFENSRCQVVVSFPMRAAPLGQLTRRYVQEGAIGRPEHVLATNYVPYGVSFFDRANRSYQVTQGLFTQKATHDFDCMMFVMGSSITRVAAMASYGRVFGGNKPSGLRCSECDETRTCLESPHNRRMNGSDPGGGGVERDVPGDHLCPFRVDIGSPETGMDEDSASMLVEFASGAHGFYTQVFFTRRDAGARHHVYSGYHGTLQLDWYKNEVRRVRHHEPFTGVTAVGGNSHALGDYALVGNFLDIIKGKDASHSTIGDGIQSTYACLAAKESSLTGQFVTVRQVGGAAG